MLAPLPALADGTDPGWPGSVLHIAVTGPRVAHKRLTITVTGTNAAQDIAILYGLRVVVVDRSLSPCQRSYANEQVIAEDNPGQARQLTGLSLSEGLAGQFKISVPFTPGGRGSVVICAYTLSTTNEAGYADVAWASEAVTLTAKAPPKPTVVSRPRVTRSGNRLRCSRGRWSGNPTSYAYRWKVIHKAGTVGRGPTLSPTRKLRGRTVECLVTANNSAGRATATSLPFTKTWSV